VLTRLPQPEWRARRAAHEARVDAWTRPHLERSGRKHPVEDFLFTYYAHRPAQLRRWSPGADVVLEGHPVEAPYVEADAGAVLPHAPERVLTTARYVHDLLTRTAERPAQLGCFGMHEWAMVYRGQRRHEDWPLRLGQAGTDEVVDALGVRCSHHDAFRFFTDAARPLNRLQPTRESQPELEQPGCLHANMDLYKWAYKLSPWVAAELVADCFHLARRVRVLDMQASPYDLTGLSLEPVPVETPAGRARYVEAQRAFAAEAAELRERVLQATAALSVAAQEPGTFTG
jgi:hypothetical protein